MFVVYEGAEEHAMRFQGMYGNERLAMRRVHDLAEAERDCCVFEYEGNPSNPGWGRKVFQHRVYEEA